ncbi:MAG: 50S ribosomal protein L32 [Candidatus Magasanikbacteria bacterium CG_4_10_14_0_2_um_filter_37_12]|uniref:Large ribosomal subunit protein bL32 n=1 Tax=Candidatus Magasanikbacteria bacterium CG_4_10_14_0_2_um_filter_37_12 TaxID=1974637 RepID=A0A2M7V7K8_9BACT|nr:MAG: 50S ribosomal protein L32 [Candidatus Magasanikbacteria bacterium CG_4_10_14_0_2_um_filter_37_12]
MGLPSKRRTNTSKKQRAAHFALKKTDTISCPNCKKAILPHKACLNCGEYKGRKVVDVAKRTTRRSKHIKPIN